MKNLKHIIVLLATSASICNAYENFYSGDGWTECPCVGQQWASYNYLDGGTYLRSIINCPYTINIDQPETDRPRGEIQLEGAIKNGHIYTIAFSYYVSHPNPSTTGGSVFFQLFGASTNGGYQLGSAPGLIVWPYNNNLVFNENICGRSVSTAGVPATDTNHQITIHLLVSTGGDGWLQCYIDGNHVGTIYGANATTSGGLIVKCGNYTQGVAADFHSTADVWNMTIIQNQ